MLKWGTLLVLALSVSCFLKYKFTPEPQSLKAFDEIESIAGFFSRDFVFDDLLEEFDFAKTAGLLSSGGRDGDSRYFYVPRRASVAQGSESNFVLLLTEQEHDKALGKHVKGARHIQSEEAAPHEPSRTNALGTTWSVGRRPLPYLIREALGAKQALPLRVIITTGGSEAINWIMAAILLFLAFCLLLFFKIRDRKLWEQ
jgi:hypothetical protein